MILSVIIPVFNEERTIKEILERILSVKLPLIVKKEIIVVDDGSTDNTRKILSKLQIINNKFQILRHNKNQGKGATIRTGLKNAKGEIVIIQDADLEYDPNYFPTLLKPILDKEAEVVYGTRLINYPLKLWGKNKTILPIHLIANNFLTCLTNFLYGSNLTDMETCYKLFKASSLKGINIKSNGFEFEPEITAKFLKNGFKITEIPIQVKPRTRKEGKKINWKDGFKAIFVLFKYRFSN